MVCFHTEAAKKSAIKLDYLKKNLHYLKKLTISSILSSWDKEKKRTGKNLHVLNCFETLNYEWILFLLKITKSPEN